jgi:hypothetical protein
MSEEVLFKVWGWRERMPVSGKSGRLRRVMAQNAKPPERGIKPSTAPRQLESEVKTSWLPSWEVLWLCGVLTKGRGSSFTEPLSRNVLMAETWVLNEQQSDNLYYSNFLW